MADTSFPFDAIALLVAYLRGRGSATWHEIGVALHRLMGWALATAGSRPDTLEPQRYAAGPPGETDEEYAQALEQLAAQYQQGGAPAGAQAAFSMPAWLMPLLLKLFEKWLLERS